jgi:hypothetical protein
LLSGKSILVATSWKFTIGNQVNENRWWRRAEPWTRNQKGSGAHAEDKHAINKIEIDRNVGVISYWRYLPEMTPAEIRQEDGQDALNAPPAISSKLGILKQLEIRLMRRNPYRTVEQEENYWRGSENVIRLFWGFKSIFCFLKQMAGVEDKLLQAGLMSPIVKQGTWS